MMNIKQKNPSFKSKRDEFPQLEKKISNTSTDISLIKPLLKD
jgi:hypothetical protein